MAIFSKTVLKKNEKPVQVKIFCRSFPITEFQKELSELEKEVNVFCEGKIIVAVRPSIASAEGIIIYTIVVEYSISRSLVSSFIHDLVNHNKK